jgi:hypothetical protein
LFIIKIFIDKMSYIPIMTSKTPKFRKDQDVVSQTGYYPLDSQNISDSVISKTNVLDNNGNAVVALYDFLSPNQRDEFAKNSLCVERKTGRSGFGMKPRAEVCYTVDGSSYNYSNVNHYTTKFPQHVLELVPVFLQGLQSLLPTQNPYTELSNSVDIMYSADFERGGSISPHADDELPWGLVLIYSLGQTRWLRLREAATGKFTNIELRDNSLIAMYGSSFQKLYTHQVDKLHENDTVGTRLSVNIRFLLPNMPLMNQIPTMTPMPLMNQTPTMAAIRPQQAFIPARFRK